MVEIEDLVEVKYITCKDLNKGEISDTCYWRGCYADDHDCMDLVL